MSLLETFKVIADFALPFLSEVGEKLDPVFKTSENDEGFINIKKGIGAVIKQKGIEFKPPSTPSAIQLGVKQISFPDLEQNRVNLPGLSNPFVRSLYDFYDLNKLRKINTIIDKNQIKLEKPPSPKQVTIKVKE